MSDSTQHTPEKTFRAMKKTDLRAYIDGCHRDRVFDADFELACRIFNDEFRDDVTSDEGFQAALQRYHHGNGSSRAVAAAAIRALQSAEVAAAKHRPSPAQEEGAAS